MRKIIFLILIIPLFSCTQTSNYLSSKTLKFHSFKDVPGITKAEIEGIELLQLKYSHLIYGMPLSVEAFENNHGEVRGFSALLCEWMSELFGIPFRPRLYEWLPLLHGLETEEISFTGELTANDERLLKYHMTTDIASRPLKYFRLANSRSIEEITKERNLKCGFIEGTATIHTVTPELLQNAYEVVIISDVSLVYDALKSGKIDVFYYSGTIEINFIENTDVIAHDFYPLIYRPVSLTTQTDSLKPIITVMEKILENGGLRYLTEMYNKGEHEYLVFKLQTQLTTEEQEYIKNNHIIPIGIDPGSYPESFFDKRENEWRGVFYDILEEIKSLTGLTFRRVNNENSDWPKIYQMLTDGEVFLVPNLIQSVDREGKFLWPEITQLTDNYALISNSDFPDIKVNEVLYVKVGLAKNTAYTTIFEKWFPNHMNTVLYENIEEAFAGLQRGEIDMVMGTQKRLLYLTHYLELPNYKTNIVFNFIADSKFGFNMDQEILCSIFNKALGSVDIKGISDRWMRQTYDYRAKLAEEQRPLYIGSSVLLLCVLALLTTLFTRSSVKGNMLKKIVEVKSNDLDMKNSMLMTILDASPDFIFCKDTKSRYTQCSNSTMDMFNINAKDMIGKTDEEVFSVPPETAEKFIKDDKNVMYIREPLIIEETMKVSDHEMYLETIKTPLIQNGKVIGIMGISRNTTKRKLMERDLEIQTSTLNALFDSIPDIIFTLDTNLRYTKCNKRFLNHFGLKNEDVIGKGEESIGFSPEMEEEHNKWNLKVIEESKEYKFEECVPGADGTTPYFETIKSPLLLDNVTIGLLGIARDISKRKEMEEKALAASVTKSAFLANMSHEIRTPMNSIMGFSELAMDLAGNPKIKDYISKIRTNSEWLLQIINNILDLSKIESGKMEMEKIPFNMHDIFASCRTLVLPKAVEKGITLHFYAEPSLGKVPLGDPTRLRQVFVNFLSNSVKFTNSGIVKLFSKIISSTDETITMHFEIKDSGIGMTSEQIDKIFDPFVQAESGTTRKYGGTGLGLSITRNIIEMMGGKIEIESAPGVGTKFSFNITFNTIDELDDNNQSIILEHTEIEKPTFKGEILLCEDNLMNQEVISEHLARVGIRTIIAENGKIGLEMVQSRMEKGEKQFGLIFMDIHMPVMDGLEASSKILALNTGVPIIAMTANIMSTDTEIYLQSGMKDCIGKPFTSQELWHLLLKYFTPIDTDNTQKSAQVEASKDFNKKILLLFLNDNMNKYKEIIKALEEGNFKEAHRFAHTLKSNAAQIGKTLLQQAAANIENRLKDGVNHVSEEQLKILEAELNAVLNELNPLFEEEAHQAILQPKKDIPMDLKKIKLVIEELEPLLKSGNSECFNYIDKLNSIPASDKLIHHIEDYEFAKALFELEGLKNIYLNM